MNKAKTLPERPQPPSFDDIIQDVENAPSDDVVFSSNIDTSFSTTRGTYVDTDKSMAMEESYLEISDNIDDDTPQEEAYRQALQFIRLQTKLESAPAQLDDQFERLQQLETEVAKSINELKQSSQALKTKT